MRAVLVLLVLGLLVGGAPELRAEPAAAAAPAVRVDVPVLLVPGWFDTDRDLAALRIRLISAGWPPESVATLSFRDPTGSNLEHAREIGVAVDSLRAATGAARVDIVAHSMGGLATRAYLQGGARGVRRVVFVASPHRGTWSAYLAWGDGADEMRPGSAFLTTLNAAPFPEGIEALTVRTPLDTHVIPGENATLAGVPDHTVCCPTHAGLLRDLETFRVIRRFLADGVTGAAS